MGPSDNLPTNKNFRKFCGTKKKRKKKEVMRWKLVNHKKVPTGWDLSLFIDSFNCKKTVIYHVVLYYVIYNHLVLNPIRGPTILARNLSPTYSFCHPIWLNRDADSLTWKMAAVEFSVHFPFFLRINFDFDETCRLWAALCRLIMLLYILTRGCSFHDLDFNRDSHLLLIWVREEIDD